MQVLGALPSRPWQDAAAKATLAQHPQCRLHAQHGVMRRFYHQVAADWHLRMALHADKRFCKAGDCTRLVLTSRAALRESPASRPSTDPLVRNTAGMTTLPAVQLFASVQIGACASSGCAPPVLPACAGSSQMSTFKPILL